MWKTLLFLYLTKYNVQHILWNMLHKIMFRTSFIIYHINITCWIFTFIYIIRLWMVTILLVWILDRKFIFTYLNLLGAYKRDRFSIVKYALLTPIYWLMLAYATIRASFQIISDPYGWEKTVHGTHISKNVDAASAA